MKTIGLKIKDIEVLKEILQGDFDVILFGSRIQGNWRKYSDLDVCLKSKNLIPMSTISELKEKFDDSSLIFTVDLVDYNRCDSSFQNIIDTSGLMLSEC